VSDFLFELSGGALCLDFVNTVDDRPTAEPKERLNAYSELLAWAAQAGAIAPRRARALAGEAGRRPREAQAVLERARAGREALFEVLSAAAHRRRFPGPALRTLEAAMAQALGHRRLVAPGPGPEVRWVWAEDEAALDSVVWPVFGSAAELLTTTTLERVRQCAAAACDWLFLDRSKNGSRRWCDMSVCGNRDKVRRHRQRQRRWASARVGGEGARG
jgi:predicted RNA-binding Zn ribbon-like protein